MEMKSRLPQIIYTLTAIFTAGTVATTVLYQSTSKEILLTLAITFGTCAYHFIMRLLVGSIVNSILHNEYYGAAEPPVRTNGATPFYLLSYFAIAGSSPYTSLIERSLDGSTLSISIL